MHGTRSVPIGRFICTLVVPFLAACTEKGQDDSALTTRTSAAVTCADGTTCNGGVCSDAGGCVCSTGYAGPTCAECDTDYYPVSGGCRFCQAEASCSGHGTCSATGQCTCEPNFAGPSCATCNVNHYNYPSCTYCTRSTTCNNHGSCTNTGGCRCDDGYGGPQCEVSFSRFSLSVSPGALSLCANETRSVVVTTMVTQADPTNISLSISGLPNGASATFDPPSVVAGQSSTLTINSGTAAGVASAFVGINGTAVGASASATLLLTIDLSSSCERQPVACETSLASANAALAATNAALTAASAELAVSNASLAACRADLGSSQAAGADADADGIPDRLDTCPNSPSGQAVDASGCSQAQFCARVDASSALGLLLCIAGDWRNDEPLTPPLDCKVTIDRSRKSCVPAG